jgi:hexosaminidase
MKNTYALLFFLAILILNSCNNNPMSSDASFSEEDIAVKWKLVSNVLGEQEGHEATFTIQNNGENTLGNNWKMYFSMTPRQITSVSSDVAKVEAINGDFYQLYPLENFELAPGESVEISYQGGFWMIKEVDAPAGVYFVFEDEEGNEEEPIIATNYELEPFVTEEQTSRFKYDRAPVPTPESIYEENSKITELDRSGLLPVIPTPLKYQVGEEKTTLNKNFVIRYASGLQQEAEYLSDMLELVLTDKIAVEEGSDYAANAIVLTQGSVNNKNKEAYTLSINADGISINANEKAGVFYGVQSLLALANPDHYQNKVAAVELPFVEIEDAPRFEYRGIHLDVARNFQSKAAVLRVIDVMALYKLNKLHLHLTDDEGWRLEIPSLPELTEVGSKRGHTLSEDSFLQPSYGSGPIVGNSPGSGYYSKQDFIDIIQYAHKQHIEVIPELNMPGHARAAIKAMEARYRRLMEEGKEAEAEAYLLTDFEDQSVYSSAQVYNDNTVCVCKESVYQFYETIVDDVIEMYQEADVPLKTIHTGGDEVPAGVWEKSPICADFIAQEASIDSPLKLQSYFIRRIQKILAARNLVTAGWEEIVMLKQPEGGWIPDVELAGQQVLPYVWNNLWGNQDLGNKLANAGYPVVLCNVTNLYFDLAYNKDPKEPGLYWGGLVNTRKAFELIPEDGLKSTRFDAMERPFDQKEEFKNMERLKPAAVKNIAGIQGELWSETLRNPDMLEYYLLPKLYGLAERAWAKAEWETEEDQEARLAQIDEAWNVFANTLGQKEFKRIDKFAGGYNYRIPMPGAVIENNMLKANNAYPGFELRYTTDGSEPDANSALYTGPVEVSGEVRVKAFDTQGRSSRTAVVNTKLSD